MSTDLPPLTDMKPRLVTTLLGDPGGRVMQSFVRAPWSGDYYEATVDSVVSGQASNLRISRCGADGTMLDYAVLEGAGHGAAITAEYDAGQVWIWLFWGSDVGHPDGVPVRWAYNGTPSGARVLLADAETVPDPGAGDPGHINGYFAIDQAKDRIATKFSSGTTETYTLWKLSDYKAGTGAPLFTAPTTWPTGDLSAFQGFTTSDKSLYITRGGSQPSDQAPTLYELDWATGVITNSLDISQLAATTSAGPDGGHNEAEGVCLWRDSGGNPELLFGIDTGPTSNRRGLVFRLAAPVDGTKTKTVQIDAERVIDGPATNVVAAFSYDRTVRYTTGGFTPTGYADPVKLSEQSTAVLSVSDHPDLTDDSYGFVIHAKLSWDDAADPGRRKTATYTAQLSAADPAVVNLSQALVATGAVAPGQVIAGAPGHSPVVTMVGDQVAVDGVVQGAHLTADATAAQQAAAQSAQAAAASAALVGAPAGTAIDAHLGGDSTALLASSGAVRNANLTPQAGYHPLLNGFMAEGYGADPTGATASAAAIQSCLDAAKSWLNSANSPGLPSARVYATGSYLIESPLTPRSRVTVVGSASDASRLMGTGAALFATPTGGTSAAPTTITSMGFENISLECTTGPAFDIAGGFYDGLSRPAFRNVRLWTSSLVSPVWRHRGTAQMIGGSFTRCTFENRASSATNRAASSLIDVSVDAGNIWNDNCYEQCLIEARYANAPAISVTCTNGGFLWHNKWDNVIGEHCAGGFIWLAGCADFVIESCPEWDTVTSDIAAYTGNLFQFVSAAGQSNFCSGEIRRSHRIAAASASPLGSGVYDIKALAYVPTTATRKGVKIIDCDPTSAVPAVMSINGAVEVVGRTRPFKVVTATTYTVAETDPDQIVVNSASAVTLNLPASTTALFGRRVTIKNIGAGTVTIPQAVDGAAQTLTQWQKITVTTDGLNAATGRIWMSI